MALITSELATCMPTNCGYTQWIHEAFGNFWRFQISYWIIFSTIVGTALFPSLAFQTMFASSFNNLHFIYSYLFKLLLSLLFTIPNLFQLNIVGKGLFIATLIILLPFIILICLTFHECNWNLLMNVPKDFSYTGIISLVSLIYWNMSGTDCVSTMAGEVRNPRRSLPIGLLIATLLCSLSILVPLSVAASVDNPPWQTWISGSWSIIAERQGGSIMFYAFQIVSIISNLGQYIATMTQCAWQLNGMAERNVSLMECILSLDLF